MKTRIQIMIAAFALVIGTSVTAWSQQAQTDKSQKGKQQLASNEPRSNQEKFSANALDYKNRNKGGMGDSIDVVGHVALPGAVVTNLRPLEDSSAQLLEVTDSTTHTLNLVDVTDPSRPHIVQRIHKPAALENSRLEVEVGHAALFAETQGTSVRPASRMITLVNLADPANPKTVRQFANVTFMTADRTRKLIYLANPDGLWVLQAYSLADRRALEKQFDEILRSAQSGG